MSVDTSNSAASPSNPPTQSSETLVKRLFARISEVSTLPTVAVRIVEVANDPTTGAEDLLGAVRYDAALATRIMRTVNSSYYSMQNKVADLNTSHRAQTGAGLFKILHTYHSGISTHGSISATVFGRACMGLNQDSSLKNYRII